MENLSPVCCRGFGRLVFLDKEKGELSGEAPECWKHFQGFLLTTCARGRSMNIAEVIPYNQGIIKRNSELVKYQIKKVIRKVKLRVDLVGQNLPKFGQI